MRFSFGRKPQPNNYPMAEPYVGLRQNVLALDGRELGLPDLDTSSVWGVLMETGYTKAVATLVALADGTASLYFSSGGGILGSGAHESVGTAARHLVFLAPPYVAQCQKVQEYPLPQMGNTRFYLLTLGGVFSIESPEREYGEHQHLLSPLYHAAQELITAMRLVNQQQSAQ